MSDSRAVAARRAARAAKVAERAKKANLVKDRANELFRQGEYEKASEYYIAAMKLNGAPTPVLLSNLAAAYNKLTMYEHANYAAGAALEYDPRMIKARYRRALARKEIFGYKAAKEDLEGILYLEPANPDAKEQLIQVNELIRIEGGFPVDPSTRYPRVNDEPWEVYYDSDSEECNHKRNRTPCRFYNHEGCRNGSQCSYSHAPDDKSVRDELGKNVCLHFLFSDCTYGAEKCIYSHSRAYLPQDGWWNNPMEVVAAKKSMADINSLATDYLKLRDVLIDNPLTRRYATRIECQSVLAAHECSDENAIYESILKAKPSDPPTPPFILVLSLEYQDFLTSVSKHLFATLEKTVKTVHIRDTVPGAVDKALDLLESPHLKAVLVADAGIAKKRNNKVVQKLVEFVQKGGSVAIGDQFSNFITGTKFSALIKKFGLDWQYGSYFRSTFFTNASNELVQKNPSLPKSYSMKTLHVKNITPEMAVYAATEDSRLTSMVYDPVKVSEFSTNEAPAVSAQVGAGRLSFLGDVNGETSSTPVILAMLGILDTPQPQAVQASTSTQPRPSTSTQSRASTSTQPQASTSTQPQASTSTAGPSATIFTDIESMLQHGYQGPARTKFFSPEENAPGAKAAPEKTTNVQPAKITDKFVLLLELDGQSPFRTMFAAQIAVLESRIDVKTASDGADALELLKSPQIQGVYVVDAGIAEPENSAVVEALSAFALAGGQLVFGGLFPSDMESDNVRPFFSLLGLTWKAGSYCKSEAQLNRHHETAVRNPGLRDAYYMKAVHLQSFHLEAMLHQQHFDEYDTQPHFEPPGGDEWECAVLRQPVGKGRIGYIGDVGPEPESTEVLLAMLELLTPPTPVVPDSSKFMLVLSGYDAPTLQQFVPDFLKDAASRVEVHYGLAAGGLSKARVIDFLPSGDLVGVLVMDTEVLYPHNAYLLTKLVEYSKGGGTLVFGWQFCKLVTLTQFRPLFRDNWGLDWDMVGIHLDTVKVKSNSENLLVKDRTAKLSKSATIKGIQVKGIDESTAVYSPTKKQLWNPEQNIFIASILFAPVEKGHLGYLGAPTLDDEVRSALYAMFGMS